MSATQRATLLLLPAAVPVAAVLSVAVLTAGLQSLGLVPLVGRPELTVAAYSADGLGGSILLTLSIAVGSTAVAAVVGFAAALAVLAGGRAVALAGLLTVPVPHLVGAASMGLLLADSGLAARVLGVEQSWPQLVGGPWWVAVIAEHAWKESAFVALVVAAALSSRLAPHTETAATLGAGPLARLRHVTLPLAAPALVASAGIVLVYTLGSYEVARLLGRPAPEPLAVGAVRRFGSIDLAARPQAAAAAVITMALSLLAVAVVVAVLRRLAAWR